MIGRGGEREHHRRAATWGVVDPELAPEHLGEARERPRGRGRRHGPTRRQAAGTAGTRARARPAGCRARDRSRAATRRSRTVPPSMRTGCSGGDHESALSTTFAIARSRSAGSTFTRGRLSGTSTITGAARSPRLTSARPTISSMATSAVASWRLPDLEPAHRQEVVHELGETVDLLVDRRVQLPRRLGVEVEIVGEQCRRRGLDRRERCAQVVGHGSQQRGAQRVGLGEGGGGGSFGSQLAAREHDGHLRDEGVQHPAVVDREIGAGVREDVALGEVGRPGRVLGTPEAGLARVRHDDPAVGRPDAAPRPTAGRTSRAAGRGSAAADRLPRGRCPRAAPARSPRSGRGPPPARAAPRR